MKRPKDLFICYCHEDREFVERLAADLADLGARVWWDRWELSVGDSLIDRIEEGISSSCFLGIVLSQQSVTSNWVRRELAAGLETELRTKDVFVLPLLREACDIPLFLRDKLFADFRSSYREEFESLVKKIAPWSSERRRGNVAQVGRALLAEGRFAGADLADGDLRGWDLEGADLAGAALMRADLSGANLRKASLAGANLERARLCDTDLSKTDLFRTNLWGANLRGARGLVEVGSWKHANIFGIEDVSSSDLIVLREHHTLELADYSEFLQFYRSTVGLSDRDLLATFRWLASDEFREMLGFQRRRD